MLNSLGRWGGLDYSLRAIEIGLEAYLHPEMVIFSSRSFERVILE